MKFKIECKICKKEFLVWHYLLNKRKYCSFQCRDNDIEFIQKISDSKKGILNPIHRPEVRIKASKGWFNMEKSSGNKNINWKGDKVGYTGLHKWIARKLGQPNICENCGKINLSQHKIHWANKSHQYKRDLNDWIRLCAKCHKKYDLNYINLHQ